MTGDCYVFKFLQCSVVRKYFVRLQNETSVFKFLELVVDMVLHSVLYINYTTNEPYPLQG